MQELLLPDSRVVFKRADRNGGATRRICICCRIVVGVSEPVYEVRITATDAAESKEIHGFVRLTCFEAWVRAASKHGVLPKPAKKAARTIPSPMDRPERIASDGRVLAFLRSGR